LANGRLFQEEIESLEELVQVPAHLGGPGIAHAGRKTLGQAVLRPVHPEDAMDEDIEESARFYEEDNGELHIRSDFLIADDDEPRTVRVAFILNQDNDELRSKGVLFSIHDEDVPVFRLLRMRARRAPGLIEDAKEVLLKLFDADAEYSADTLEGIYDELEKVGKQGAVRRRDRCHGRRGAGRDCTARRHERPHSAQRDGHPPRGELHDAQQDAQWRTV